MPKMTGQCLCGAVTVSSETTPAFTANCHCTECRRSTGAAFATLMFYNTADLTITGNTRTYEHQSDRNTTMKKHFCPECGSQMFGESGARENMLGVRAGIVNETELVQPQRNLFTDSKIPSTPLDSELPAHEKMP